jgi:hypothetical protein
MIADKDQEPEPVNTYVLYKTTSGRRAGRPKRTYLDQIIEHTAEFILQDKKAKLSVDEIIECAMDKKTWKDVIDGIKILPHKPPITSGIRCFRRAWQARPMMMMMNFITHVNVIL